MRNIHWFADIISCSVYSPNCLYFSLSVLAAFEKYIKLHFPLFKNEPELKSTSPEVVKNPEMGLKYLHLHPISWWVSVLRKMLTWWKKWQFSSGVIGEG